MEANYLFSYGSPAEIKARLDEAEGGGPADADNPYAGFMQVCMCVWVCVCVRVVCVMLASEGDRAAAWEAGEKG